MENLSGQEMPEGMRLGEGAEVEFDTESGGVIVTGDVMVPGSIEAT